LGHLPHEWRRFFGNGGLPIRRDFHRQNIRKAVRGHLRNVSGLTITNAFRQSKKLANATLQLGPTVSCVDVWSCVPGKEPVAFAGIDSQQ
jgi:hypothetical protein